MEPTKTEYTIAEATALLRCSRATLDRWIPVGTPGRRRTMGYPGKPSEVRISRELVEQHLPAPGGDE